jgi:hypothetical protein
MYLKDDLLLAKCLNELTAWDIAALNGKKEILEKLCCWGRELQVNLKDDLLPAKYMSVLSAWHTAAENDFVQRKKYFACKDSKPSLLLLNIYEHFA